MDSEKRKFSRIDQDVMVSCEKYSIPRSGEAACEGATTRNISPGGVLFISPVSYEVGDVLRLELKIPGWENYKAEFYKPDRLSESQPFIVICNVVRSSPQGKDFEIGVEFTGLDDGHQLALRKYLGRRKK